MPSQFSPQQGSSGLPSITEIMGLKLRMDSAKRAESSSQFSQDFATEGRDLARSQQQVRRVLQRFKGYEGTPKQLLYSEAAKLSPEVRQAFEAAGEDINLALTPLQLSQEEKIQEGTEAVEVKLGIDEATESAQAAAAIRAQERENAVQTSVQGEQAFALKAARQQKVFEDKTRLAAELQQNNRVGFVRNPDTGSLQPSRYADSIESGLSFVDKAAGLEEIKKEEGFNAQMDILIPKWTADPKEMQTRYEELFSNDTEIGRANTQQSYMTRLIQNYHGFGSGERRKNTDIERSIFRKLLLNEDVKGMSKDDLLDRLINSQVNNGSPSPYAFMYRLTQSTSLDIKQRRALVDKLEGEDVQDKFAVNAFESSFSKPKRAMP